MVELLLAFPGTSGKSAGRPPGGAALRSKPAGGPPHGQALPSKSGGKPPGGPAPVSESAGGGTPAGPADPAAICSLSLQLKPLHRQLYQRGYSHWRVEQLAGWILRYPSKHTQPPNVAAPSSHSKGIQ